MRVLGIESSCDETSAAVVHDGVVYSNIISSQLIHQQYGGVVPELASRAHQRMIVPIVDEALKTAAVTSDQIGGVAATYGPGLMGALMVGLNFAKAFAMELGVPFVGINHLEAHLYSNFIDKPVPGYPFLCLIVSGGHTELVLVDKPLSHTVLGETLDDAAGEAYDKVAKMLGLGFPGGPVIDRLARDGNPEFINFPRSYLGEGSFNFSFSGIKTSVLYWLKKHGYHTGNGTDHPPGSELLADICASFQNAILDVLVGKTLEAIRRTGVKNVAIAGGVSANTALRARMEKLAVEENFSFFIPKFEYCTDNGAMVAWLGQMKLAAGERSADTLTPIPNLTL